MEDMKFPMIILNRFNALECQSLRRKKIEDGLVVWAEIYAEARQHNAYLDMRQPAKLWPFIVVLILAQR
jgi:hypothetical protein